MAKNSLKMAWRYATGLRRFLRQPMTREECHRHLGERLERRVETFLHLIRRGVYEQASSPYRRLLEHAGIELGAVEELTRRLGIEGALIRLREAGVFVTSNEFKGRQPIRRGGLELEVRSEDFDNPLLARQYLGQTSGSRGPGRRVALDFDLIENDAAYLQCVLDAFALNSRPILMWKAAPPVTSGISQALRYAKLGVDVDHWYATGPLLPRWRHVPFWGLTKYTAWGSRLAGRAIPSPTYLPLSRAPQVARLLARFVRAGTPPLADTGMSSALQICHAAHDEGLDIGGTFFRLGGEPYTARRAEVLAEVGCRGAAFYSMAETGNLATPCADAVEVDDVHVMTDKIAVYSRPHHVPGSDRVVDALVLTSVSPSCPKLLLNVMSDDYGFLERRQCTCVLGHLGFDQHLHGIRSYDKLTSNGVTYLGSDLIDLLERVLPRRFGGGPVDYQLVEQECDGAPRVELVVHPRVGDLDHASVTAAVFEFLERVPGGIVMANEWRQARLFRIDRRAPHTTTSAKILPLHVLGDPGDPKKLASDG